MSVVDRVSFRKVDLIMQMTAEQALMCYADAYYRVNRYIPDDLCALDEDWGFVNGVRIHVSEVEWLTACLEQEFAMQQKQRGNIVRMIQLFAQ